jgi:serine/threonine protein kinase/Tfp pilus assembly protein PilF
VSIADRARWQQARSLFDKLIDLTPIEQTQKLIAIRAGDAELASTVQRLLDADGDAEQRLSGLDSAIGLLASGKQNDSISKTGDFLNLAGRTIGHFKVHAPIAAGGMGVVYRGEDMRLRRGVALKFPLPANHLDASVKDRFLREARSVAGLDHPNVCSVYETGESEDGRLFLAMPLYDGETLKSRIAREGALPIGDALAIARQVANGLACAHAAGIVHRDLKPGNLMLLPSGDVKILDFGLATVGDLTRTASNNMLGTASYMAPEQVRGIPVDGRADLWALGVLLYEMLVGRRPFGGENEISIAHAVLHAHPAPPTSVRAEIPHSIEHLVSGLLQKDRDQRYATAQAVLDDVERIQHGEKPALRLPSRHLRRRVGLSAFAILLIVLGAFGIPRLLEMQRDRSTDREANELFLRGRDYELRAWGANTWNEEWLRAAETFYRRALVADPQFAHAHGRLANVLFATFINDSVRFGSRLEEGRREAEAAIALQPKLGQGHLVMSWYWDQRKQPNRALAELQLARKGSPRDPEVRANMGYKYLEAGRWDDAVNELRRAAKLSPQRGVQLASIYARLRRFELSARTYDEYLADAPDGYGVMLFKGYMFLRWRGTTDSLSAVLRRMPQGWDVGGAATGARYTIARIGRRPEEALAALASSNRITWAHLTQFPAPLLRAELYAQAGDVERAPALYDSARVIVEEMIAAQPRDARAHVAHAHVLAGLGQYEEAARSAELALSLAPISPAAGNARAVSVANQLISTETVQQRAEVVSLAAAVFASIHDKTRALQLLEQLLQHPASGTHASVGRLRVDPTWDPLRSDPRFEQLLHKYENRGTVIGSD